MALYYINLTPIFAKTANHFNDFMNREKNVQYLGNFSNYKEALQVAHKLYPNIANPLNLTCIPPSPKESYN